MKSTNPEILKIEIRLGQDARGGFAPENSLEWQEVKRNVLGLMAKRYPEADISIELAKHSSIRTNADQLATRGSIPEYLYYMAVEENCREIVNLTWRPFTEMRNEDNEQR